MGQYFIVCNFDKKELLDPSMFGDGMKLDELVGRITGTLMGLTYLLALSGRGGGVEWRATDPMFGRWAGDRIAIVGDYYSETVAGMTWDEEVWTRVSSSRDEWVDISEHVIPSIAAFFENRSPQANAHGMGPRSVLHPDGTATAIPQP